MTKYVENGTIIATVLTWDYYGEFDTLILLLP